MSELLVGLAEAERLQQHGDGLLALAVDADVDDVLLVDLELEPRATARDHLGVDDVLLGRGLVGVDPEVDARRPHELRHDDALGAVDDERAALRHHGEVAHEDGLLLDLTGLRVHEPSGDEQRARVRHVALAAVVLGVLRRVEDVVGQLELELAGEVLDRRDVGEDLGDTLFEEPLEGHALHRDQIGQLEHFVEAGKGQTFAGRERSQRHSFVERGVDQENEVSVGRPGNTTSSQRGRRRAGHSRPEGPAADDPRVSTRPQALRAQDTRCKPTSAAPDLRRAVGLRVGLAEDTAEERRPTRGSRSLCAAVRAPARRTSSVRGCRRGGRVVRTRPEGRSDEEDRRGRRDPPSRRASAGDGPRSAASAAQRPRGASAAT